MQNRFTRAIITNKTKGITLLEMMLVLLIMGTIVFLGFGIYLRSRMENNFSTVKYNVDTLFQGLKYFYQANCQSGALSPLNNTPPPLDAPLQIDFNTHLVGYLPTTWPAISSVVDETYENQGYSAWFNPILTPAPPARKAYHCETFGVTTGNPSGEPICTNPIEIEGTQTLLWQAQIVVKIRNPVNAQNYKAFVGADCVLDTAPDPAIPVVCDALNSPTGQYLVWQRLPSYISLDASSNQGLLNPITQGFNLQYTHDQMYELTNNPSKIPQPTQPYYKYYLCGG